MILQKCEASEGNRLNGHVLSNENQYYRSSDQPAAFICGKRACRNKAKHSSSLKSHDEALLEVPTRRPLQVM